MTEESVPQSNEPEWFLDDSTPGQGARPEWLPPKYKKASDVAKAYSELEKKLGAFSGAPENYDIASLELDENDFTLREISAVAKELNMSQEGFNKFVGRIMSAAETQEKMQLEEQLKKLGPDADRQLTQYKNSLKDHFKPEEQEIVSSWIKNADDLQAFNRIMAHTHMTNVPTMQSMHMANNFEGVKDLRAELIKNVQRFENDKAYREDFSKRMARAVAREGG
jgi:hypothetical protein